MRSIWIAATGLVVLCGGCRQILDAPKSLEERVQGTYLFREEPQPVTGHGVDILVLNPDRTYYHFYGSTGTAGVKSQKGTWNSSGSELVLCAFVAWDLYGPEGHGVALPDPANTSLSIEEHRNPIRIMIDNDRGQFYERVSDSQLK